MPRSSRRPPLQCCLARHTEAHQGHRPDRVVLNSPFARHLTSFCVNAETSLPPSADSADVDEAAPPSAPGRSCAHRAQRRAFHSPGDCISWHSVGVSKRVTPSRCVRREELRTRALSKTRFRDVLRGGDVGASDALGHAEPLNHHSHPQLLFTLSPQPLYNCSRRV